MIKPYTFKYPIKFKKTINNNNKHYNKKIKNKIFFNNKTSTKKPNKNKIHIKIINKILIKPTNKKFYIHYKTIQIIKT